eukprot:5857083-Lingulodinium_polyedra.AAC.1
MAAVRPPGWFRNGGRGLLDGGPRARRSAARPSSSAWHDVHHDLGRVDSRALHLLLQPRDPT